MQLASDHDFLNINDLSEPEINDLIELGEQFKHAQKTVHLSRPVYAANLFFENSTRTHSSFQMAEKKLGIELIGIDPATSSVKKGESLGDTIKTLQAIGIDIAVIRHAQTGWYQQLTKDPNISLSLVNAGDGSGQHPSQTLLDLMTIHDEFGSFAGLHIGIIGDLAHSRVARSDAELLHRMGVNVSFSGPREWYPADFDQFGTYYPDVDQMLPNLDVVMLLRVQLERLTENAVASFTPSDYYHTYGLSEERASLMKPNAIIMHPAPVNRGVEIASSLVEAPQSRIFTQMHNGVFARMAILATILDQRGLLED
ncbi:aspartate carbamoyltransferase catalytic subunit [Lactobacillus sp. Sy-1]|uniref:aspartate carbamoyltransferase catalytic subunit n=1 Tax=Lactobacillus sp. Sy-1 TaxID=2109645 RepID=UPI001C561B17|nr:aspartate carbamoyltransferase catalytic subunit [Lactobacillus sp. Sy-1]MBW1605657.1 aspartate carbamoyltransferase catalytic subunit [Lactobacillus sp. Sy-1]